MPFLNLLPGATWIKLNITAKELVSAAPRRTEIISDKDKEFRKVTLYIAEQISYVASSSSSRDGGMVDAVDSKSTVAWQCASSSLALGTNQILCILLQSL